MAPGRPVAEETNTTSQTWGHLARYRHRRGIVQPLSGYHLRATSYYPEMVESRQRIAYQFGDTMTIPLDAQDSLLANEFLARYDGVLTPDNYRSELYRWLVDQQARYQHLVTQAHALGKIAPEAKQEAARFGSAQYRIDQIGRRLVERVQPRSIPDPLIPVTPYGRANGYDVPPSADNIAAIPMSEWAGVRGNYVASNEDQGLFGSITPTTRRR